MGILIVDPPRSGLDDTMKETILKSKIKTMIYVSCNPATLAKDLGVLKKEYRIVKIQPGKNSTGKPKCRLV